MLDKWVDPERIYLQPLCCVSPFEGRQWCEDNVWPVDGECEEAGVEYVRADLIQSLLDERDVVIGRLLDLIDELYRKYGVELDEADTLVARNARTNSNSWTPPSHPRTQDD